MSSTKVNNDTFDTIVLESTEPTLVDFYADWCGPCRVMAPALDELSQELSGRANVVKVDVDKAPELASRYEVRSIPNVVLFKDGAVKLRLIGAQSKQALLDAIQPHLN